MICPPVPEASSDVVLAFTARCTALLMRQALPITAETCSTAQCSMLVPRSCYPVAHTSGYRKTL